MATNTIPPIPYKTPVIDENGIVTQAWSKWFLFLFTQLSIAQSEVEALNQGRVL